MSYVYKVIRERGRRAKRGKPLGGTDRRQNRPDTCMMTCSQHALLLRLIKALFQSNSRTVIPKQNVFRCACMGGDRRIYPQDNLTANQNVDLVQYTGAPIKKQGCKKSRRAFFFRKLRNDRLRLGFLPAHGKKRLEPFPGRHVAAKNCRLLLLVTAKTCLALSRDDR